jgi:hypothetical protein
MLISNLFLLPNTSALATLPRQTTKTSSTTSTLYKPCPIIAYSHELTPIVPSLLRLITLTVHLVPLSS